MISKTAAPQSKSTDVLSERQPMILVWAVLAALLVALSVTLGGHLRLTLLRTVLALTAVGEALAFASNAFGPRRFAEQNGRPFHPAFHGVMQDFGFYNLAFAGLLALAALDPRSNRGLLAVMTASYVVHALAHIFRYFGIYFGGGHSIPTRPKTLELRDGLQLIVPALGILLFFPS